MQWHKQDTWYAFAMGVAITIVGLVIASNFGIIRLPIPTFGQGSSDARIEFVDAIQPAASSADPFVLVLDVPTTPAAADAVRTARVARGRPRNPVVTPAPEPGSETVREMLTRAVEGAVDTATPILSVVSPLVATLTGLFRS